MGGSNVVRVDPLRISQEAMKAAGEIVTSGGLVVYPTETFYGLGANALDGKAVGRVYQAKGRPANKPLVVLARDLDQLKELVSEIPPWARTLMGLFWPDGLTLILSAASSVPRELLAGGTSIAVRISGHPVVRALLKTSGVPLTSSSANRSGCPAPTTVAAARRQLGDRVDLFIDGGTTEGGDPSTILDARSESVRLVRSGRIPVGDIRKIVPLEIGETARRESDRTILFVCTGNTCRSAMAQGLFRKMLSSRNLTGFQVRSAGTSATEGAPPTALAQQVARQQDGIDISGYRARPLTRELLEAADIVLAMSLSHARQIESMGRRFARKTYLLTSYPAWKHPDPEDIEDPIGRPREDYIRVYRRIRDQLERILPVMLKEYGKDGS